MKLLHLLPSLLLAGTAAVAQTSVVIERIAIESAQVQVLVRHPFAGSPTFALQGATNLANWRAIPGVTFLDVDASHVELRFPKPAAAHEFFRVLAFLSTNDVDGDGLPNEAELAVGTNPNLFDSDSDGFSDGGEYAYDTNPNDRNSYPALTTLPRAEFAAAMSSGTEGSGPHGVMVRFDKPYFGTLRIGVATNSTARASVDYLPLPTNVTVAGASVVIPITWIDDAVISPDRLLFLEIKSDPGLSYARGGQTHHTVLLGENDAWRSGVLADKYAQRNLQLKLRWWGYLRLY